MGVFAAGRGGPAYCREDGVRGWKNSRVAAGPRPVRGRTGDETGTSRPRGALVAPTLAPGYTGSLPAISCIIGVSLFKILELVPRSQPFGI